MTSRARSRRIRPRAGAGSGGLAGGRLTARNLAQIAVVGSVLCMAPAPVGALAAAFNSAPAAQAGTASAPSLDATGPRLTLTKSVSRTFATVGRTLTYTVTVRNTGSLPATNVVIDDVLGGDAGYVVNDGTLGTVNSFAGSTVITVTRLVTGHYRWAYPAIGPGVADIVRFSAVITRPPVPLAHSNGTMSLTNTASAPGVAPVTVRTTAPYSVGGRGGVRGIATGTPTTGTSPDVAGPGLIVLVGIGLILAGMLARKAEQHVRASAG